MERCQPRPLSERLSLIGVVGVVLGGMVWTGWCLVTWVPPEVAALEGALAREAHTTMVFDDGTQLAAPGVSPVSVEGRVPGVFSPPAVEPRMELSPPRQAAVAEQTELVLRALSQSSGVRVGLPGS